MDAWNLWTAIVSEQYHLVNQMLYCGANVNEPLKTRSGLVTLLHYAVAQSDLRCIRVLANIGANVNAVDYRNRTPLHWAAASGAGLDIFEVLINEGAVVDARDDEQKTPLHHAVEHNCIESAEMLINRRASINASDEKGRSVLHMAITCSDLKMIKLLISHRVNIDPRDNNGNTPLITYLSEFKKRERTMEIIELLLDNGADVNAKEYNGIFPLFLAAKFKSLVSLYYLLDRGARVNDATLTGETALHVACKNGLSEIMISLLESGANLNARNKKKKQAFKRLPNEETVQIIIKESAIRQAVGLPPYKGYIKMLLTSENYVTFHKECLDEIMRMLREKIDAEDSAISLFHIVLMDEDKLAALAKDKKIVTVFESSGYVALFKIYGSELSTQFEIFKKHANLAALIERKLAAYIKYGYIT